MFPAQLLCVDHRLPSLCWGLKGCGCILGGVVLCCVDALSLCSGLLCLCSSLCRCVCILSKVLYVVSAAFQLATQTAQLMLHFEVLCLRFNIIVPCCCWKRCGCASDYPAYVAMCRVVPAF